MLHKKLSTVFSLFCLLALVFGLVPSLASAQEVPSVQAQATGGPALIVTVKFPSWQGPLPGLILHDERGGPSVINVLINGTTYTATQVITSTTDWIGDLPANIPTSSNDVMVVKDGVTYPGYTYALTKTVGSLSFIPNEYAPVTVNPLEALQALPGDHHFPVNATESYFLGIHRPETNLSSFFDLYIDNNDTTHDHWYDVWNADDGDLWTGVNPLGLYQWDNLRAIWLLVADSPLTDQSLKPESYEACSATLAQNQRVGAYNAYTSEPEPLLYLRAPRSPDTGTTTMGVEISGELWNDRWQPISATIEAVPTAGFVITSEVTTDFEGKPVFLVHESWPDGQTDPPALYEVVFRLKYDSGSNGQYRTARPIFPGWKTQCPLPLYDPPPATTWFVYLPFVVR